MKIILLLLFTLNILYANTLINFDKGWKLVGVPNTISDMSIFDIENIAIIWSYNASKKSWEGYSPDVVINEQIKNNLC